MAERNCERNCACKAFGAIECARIRHVRSCDDFQRSIEMEEADNFDSSDACECCCHEREPDDYEDWELNP